MSNKALYFPKSDGTLTRWPDELDPTPINGEVNYMKPVDFDEYLSVQWRSSIGSKVAKLLDYEDFMEYTLEDFPGGYRLYCHYKGAVAGPRTDLYLYGSPVGRFSSVPEFIPHAYWLITDETLTRANCKCKYCSKSKSPIKIGRDLGLTSSGGTVGRGDPNKPNLRLIARGRKESRIPLSPDRVADLKNTRRYRRGELVWTALYPAIEGETKDERIEFWPGMIKEFNLKVDIDSHLEKESWAVKQYHIYHVQLLGVPCSDTLPEWAILPYQACGPSNELIECLRMAGKPNLIEEDKGNSAELCPVPLGTTKFFNKQQLRFGDAATPFAFAIEIAAHLVQFWTAVQEYTYNGEVPSTSPLATKAADGRCIVEIKENRCQGLWWGAERIWMDELVILQLSRAQIFSGGSELISPPSPRADGRGVLMRINSILSLPGETADSPRVCKVAGALYELAEESYAQPSPSSHWLSTPTDPAPPAIGCPSTALPLLTLVTSFANEKLSPAEPFEQTPISQGLAHMPPYPLPKPPVGFKFLPIMKSGYEAVLDVAFVRGRYYPGLLDHPSTMLPRRNQVTSLTGLITGAVNSMQRVEWAVTREEMLQSSYHTARQDLLKHWHLFTAEAGRREDLAGPPLSLMDMN